MRRALVAGNWKMNGTTESIQQLLDGLVTGCQAGNSEVLVCPPSIYLAQVASRLATTDITWGAQNVSQHASGAYTGEVSPAMLVDLGCQYVIVGHSERRALYAESDVLVAEKFSAALAAGVKPILCVGETLEEREQGATLDVIQRQLQAVVSYAGIADFADAVVAYEPVWAIGTGKTATAEQAQEVHQAIRAQLAEADSGIAAGCRIVYGGSVNAGNAAELFAKPDVDGGLVGGASLKANEFITICQAAGEEQTV
ncbi:triose-phosphate isomerase [Pontibacter sp. JAM-7]|uniref:triose-phosphate isomerase n=1 Tax=Pontibacter sp. JAM-7 TaxID=3366581 RepID=UPI003AF86A64